MGFVTFQFGNNGNLSVLVCSAGSRGTDENNEDYLSKEVRSNNFLNLASTRKRVTKVTPVLLCLRLIDLFIKEDFHASHMVTALNSASALCVYTNRMKKNQKAWTLFTRESGNFTWRRFVDDIITYNNHLKMSERFIICCLSLRQPTCRVTAPYCKTPENPKRTESVRWPLSCWPCLKAHPAIMSGIHR